MKLSLADWTVASNVEMTWASQKMSWGDLENVDAGWDEGQVFGNSFRAIAGKLRVVAQMGKRESVEEARAI